MEIRVGATNTERHSVDLRIHYEFCLLYGSHAFPFMGHSFSMLSTHSPACGDYNPLPIPFCGVLTFELLPLQGESVFSLTKFNILRQ